MAHGENAARKSNRLKEWWSRRPFYGVSYGSNPGINKLFKRFTHKIERQLAKQEINREDM